MTDDQEALALRSLADELSRLAHAKPLADTDDDRYFDESIDLAYLFRVIPTMCPHHVAELSRLVAVLCEREAVEPEHDEIRITQ